MIKRLAGARWGRLKSEVMATLGKFYDKQPLAEVLLFEQEWDAAIKVADQKGAYHTVVETVAEALIPHRPEWVIRASIRQAEELIVQTKSNLYPAAADWLKRAKAAYAKLGRTSEWQKYYSTKRAYKRRPARNSLARLWRARRGFLTRRVSPCRDWAIEATIQHARARLRCPCEVRGGGRMAKDDSDRRKQGRAQDGDPDKGRRIEWTRAHMMPDTARPKWRRSLASGASYDSSTDDSFPATRRGGVELPSQRRWTPATDGPS